MTARSLRTTLRAHRRNVRTAMRQARARLRENLHRHPAMVHARARQRRRRLLTLLLLLLLLLFWQCPVPPQLGDSPPAPQQRTQEPAQVAPVRVPAPRPTDLGNIEQTSRARFAAVASDAPTWLESFRLQVAARSPRLAACFVGAERTGALRWTVRINWADGTLTEHEFAPVGTTQDVNPTQRQCVIDALSTPPYRLSASESPEQNAAMLPKVSLVIEF